MTRAPLRTSLATARSERDWYKDAIIYELHVRAFADSDGDGRGDFRGLAGRLDYLHQLGVTAIWLLPFYPSPLHDDGYDIADYLNIHPDYGTLADFRAFVEEAHAHGLRVITELVLNHTSDQHPWFQRARTSPPGSRWRDFYIWSDTPDRYQEARIIFQDFETSNWAWDPVAKAHYWHRFYSHQPDLNFRNPQVRRMMFRAVDFWLGMGVDGLRLDAVPYLYAAEGTDCENLPETHEFLADLRRHVDERFSDRMLLAEANQWPEDASAYFGDGDECHMAFHFPLMPRLFMALRMEDRFPIIDIMQQTPEIPPAAQWALFLRNHDELTLEMVTDEERDYMYRSYARDPVMRVNLGIRRRLAPLLQYHRQKIELMHGLLMSLPGTPVLYYGDEIGMGDNVYLGDRNSVRTPMQWNGDRNAGFSTANPQRLFLPVNTDPQCHYESVNVAAQLDNPDSLLRWIRRSVALRKRHRVFGRGRMDFVQSDNPRVLSFIRHDEHEQILVIANLSRFAQFVRLDLAAYRGMTPLELSGQTEFPMVGELPYLITLGSHAFYWLALRPSTADEPAKVAEPPALRVSGAWWHIVESDQRRRLEAALPAILRSRRWFGAKDRRIHATSVIDRITLPLPSPAKRAEILVVAVEYLEGDPERYLLPVVYVEGEAADALRQDHPDAVLARLHTASGDGLLSDAHFEPSYGRALAELVLTRKRRKGETGSRLSGSTLPKTSRLLAAVSIGERAPVRIAPGEQSNTSLVLGEPDGTRAVLKSYRRLESGVHPELELDRHLTVADANVALLLGAIELSGQQGRATSVAILHEFVLHETDAWASTLRSVGAWLEQTVPGSPETPIAPADHRGHVVCALSGEVPRSVETSISETLSSAELLGTRTGQLHEALARGGHDPGFVPDRVSALSQRALYQSMRTSARRAIVLVRQRMRQLPARAQPLARELLEREPHLLAIVAEVLEVRSGVRIRAHGDLHLGQVLFTGRDYVFVDFEGEPARSFGERRLKRSPLADVAGMLRSYHYAAHTAVDELVSRGVLDDEEGAGTEVAQYREAAERWAFWTAVAFLQGYLPLAASDGLLPESTAELAVSVRAQMLDKACYELRYEIGNRPDWVHLPLLGILSLLSPGRAPS
jgi:maltose alpha-D-glucosyltransferase/alpha-amylase